MLDALALVAMVILAIGIPMIVGYWLGHRDGRAELGVSPPAPPSPNGQGVHRHPDDVGADWLWPR